MSYPYSLSNIFISFVKILKWFVIIFVILAVCSVFFSSFLHSNKKREYVSHGLNESRSAKKALAEHYEKYKQFPKDSPENIHKAFNLKMPWEYKADSINSITVASDGVIRIVFSEKVHNGFEIWWTPILYDTEDGDIKWRCSVGPKQDMLYKLAPAECRQLP